MNSFFCVPATRVLGNNQARSATIKAGRPTPTPTPTPTPRLIFWSMVRPLTPSSEAPDVAAAGAGKDEVEAGVGDAPASFPPGVSSRLLVLASSSVSAGGFVVDDVDEDGGGAVVGADAEGVEAPEAGGVVAAGRLVDEVFAVTEGGLERSQSYMALQTVPSSVVYIAALNRA